MEKLSDSNCVADIVKDQAKEGEKLNDIKCVAEGCDNKVNRAKCYCFECSKKIMYNLLIHKKHHCLDP